ncbi:MAG: PEGA domain-containing protein, partial [Planctomycetota bacterium]
GCVERILAVRSDPPGARVFVDGREVGMTPCEHEFSFYGTVEVTVRAPGHVSHRELAPLPAPWYQVFPLDFFADLVVPWTIRDVHQLWVELQPSPPEVAPAVRRDLDARAGELAPLLPSPPGGRRTEGP